jgi:8-amino-7-oxononanoate synthase
VTAFLAWLEEQAVRREESGLTRRLVESDEDAPALDLAGNDYLGLSRDPRVIAAGVAALEHYGAGATA